MTLATILFRNSYKNFSRIIFMPSLICVGFLIFWLANIV